MNDSELISRETSTEEMKSGPLWKDYLFLFGVVSLIIVMDQWTKSLVRNNIAFGNSWLPDNLSWLSPIARIVHWRNTGAAFGMFQNNNTFFMILAVIVSGLIVYYFPQIPRNEWYIRFAMCLQMGGALGNLIDRVIFGHVTDFISVYTFAVFNVADTSITIGALALVLGVWITEWHEKSLLKEIEEKKMESDSGVIETRE